MGVPALMPHKTAEARREYMREWRRRNPGKRWCARAPQHVRNAGEAVRRAIRSGRLIRPGTCEECGIAGAIEAAHSDYTKPLDVRWLCQPCHRAWDSREPKACKP